jgi:hypothetical protein
MADGKPHALGPRDEVLAKVLAPPPRPSVPLKVVGDAQGAGA